ncbi:MAG: family 10 glycosylhydrolase [Acholeplasma sp.]|nr:family 10 glycosylhydrolase [Acholeplasma sp.]
MKELSYYQNKEKKICYFKTNEAVTIPEVYHEKELRAFWVSNVVNSGFPIFENEDQYKKKIEEIFLAAKSFNINNIFYQVRPLNDTFYYSELNPSSRYLMGKEGVNPPFDVFEYIIEKGKEYEIKIHAWCNPYRVSMELQGSKETYLASLDDLNFAKKYPEHLIMDANNKLILNPTRNEVKDFILASMIEIAKKYDVASIHWDDYFYPYAALSEESNDLKDYEMRKDLKMSIGDFRRFHVTDIIKKVYLVVKKIKPNMQFGVSSFGIWMSKENDPRGSNTAKNTSESYETQYADSYEWVKKGYIDYIVPQLYWEFGHNLAPFADLAKWWNDLVEGTKVKLYIGHASYRLGNEGEYENPLEVCNQVKYANNLKNVSGNVFFTYKNFLYKDVSKQGMDELKKLLEKK